MDFYVNLAISVVLQVIRDTKRNKAVLPALAKVYAKIEVAALHNPDLQNEIEHQRKKEGLL